MTIDQISVFLENKPGTLAELTETIARNKINMRAMSLADTADFGIARIIVDDSKAVAEMLRSSDYIVKVNSVLALEIPDESGSLNKILKLLGENGRNIEYMYGFTGRKTNSAYMIMRATNVPATEEVLAKAGIKLIGEKDLSQL